MGERRGVTEGTYTKLQYYRVVELNKDLRNFITNCICPWERVVALNVFEESLERWRST